MLFNELGGKAGLLCDVFHKLFVIEGNTQFFGNHTANRQSARTVFSADGDDSFFHNIASLLSGYLYYSYFHRKCQLKRGMLGETAEGYRIISSKLR